MRFERELLKGVAPMAVLQTLSRGAMYGYELGAAIEQSSQGILTLGHGTLYPLLYNLEAKQLIRAEWQSAENGRERRYYIITPDGQAYLEARREEWRQLSTAMSMVLGFGIA